MIWNDLPSSIWFQTIRRVQFNFEQFAELNLILNDSPGSIWFWTNGRV